MNRYLIQSDGRHEMLIKNLINRLFCSKIQSDGRHEMLADNLTRIGDFAVNVVSNAI